MKKESPRETRHELTDKCIPRALVRAKQDAFKLQLLDNVTLQILMI